MKSFRFHLPRKKVGNKLAPREGSRGCFYGDEVSLDREKYRLIWIPHAYRYSLDIWTCTDGPIFFLRFIIPSDLQLPRIRDGKRGAEWGINVSGECMLLSSVSSQQRFGACPMRIGFKQECCFFRRRQWHPTPGPWNLLDLPCLLATAILDSFSLFYLPNNIILKYLCIISII